MTSVKWFSLFCEPIKHFTRPKQKHALVNKKIIIRLHTETLIVIVLSVVKNNMCCHVNFLNGATLTLSLVISRNNGDVNLL